MNACLSGCKNSKNALYSLTEKHTGVMEEIVVLDAYSVNRANPLGADRAFGHMTIYDHTPPEEIAQRLKNADIAFTNRGRLGETEFAAAPSCAFSRIRNRYDKIDRAAARRHNIAVCNVPGTRRILLAQHVDCAAAGDYQRAAALDAEIRAGRWTPKAGDCSWDAPIWSSTEKTLACLAQENWLLPPLKLRGARHAGHRHSRMRGAAFPAISFVEGCSGSRTCSLSTARQRTKRRESSIKLRSRG